MLKIEYLKYSTRRELLFKLDWIFTFFTVQDKNMKEIPYLKVNNGKYEVKLDSGWEKLDDAIVGEPIFKMLDPVRVTKDMISNVKSDIDTTIGRFLSNKILLEYPFKDKLPYINNKFSVTSIEKDLSTKLRTGDVSVREYLLFVDGTIYISGFSRITNVSATYKSMLPPAGLEKYKKEVIAELEKKYGKNWVNTRIAIVDYEKALKEYDAKWLEDDPSNGKLMSGKIKDNARAKQFLTFGAEVGFDKTGTKVNFVNNSLLDEYPEDPEKLAAMFNTSRAASYDRGKDTQKGGAAAKDILRATSNVSVKDGDCGSKLGLDVLITKDNQNSLIGRNYISGSSVKTIEDGVNYIGKILTIRSPMYCKEKGSIYCTTCVGEIMKDYKKGFSLLSTEVSGTMLNASMKSMHNAVVKTMKFNINEAIS